MRQKTEDRGQMTEYGKIRAESPANLRLSMAPAAFYSCRGYSTNRPCFFKTKPICSRGKIEVSSVLRRDYEEKPRPAGESKQSQTNPISGKANGNVVNIHMLAAKSSRVVIPIATQTDQIAVHVEDSTVCFLLGPVDVVLVVEPFILQKFLALKDHGNTG